MISKKQQIARANFKKAIKEAQALRKKNPKLTQTEALKKAFAASKKVGAIKNKILGALPIDFKGIFYGYKFKIINQYQIDGGVTSQIIGIDDGKLVAELSGNPLENKRAVNALVSLGLPKGFLYTSKDEKEAERRISRFVVNLNKEVKDYNTGKDTTKKKSKGLKLVVKTQTKKLAVIDQIKSILKTDKKILKGGYKIKTGIMREKKISGLHNIGEIEASDFTRISNDVNGNPRYVIHFLQILNDQERLLPFNEKFNYAIKKAKKLGGRKFDNKQYGGGIVFQSYNIYDLAEKIEKFKNI